MNPEPSFDVRRRALARRSLAVLCVIGGGSGELRAQSRSEPGPVLVLGDSLSAEYGLRRGEGWVERIRQRLARRLADPVVVNASISGETTAGGRSRVGELLARHRPSVIVVELGGNDALRGLDLAATEANLRAIGMAARDAGARVVLAGMKVPPNYGRSYTERFQQMFSRVAAEGRYEFVPFLLEGVAERIELFQADRIHPNEQAQPAIADNVWPALQRALVAAGVRP
jgi:acyl-CoA thioesterase-1